MNEPATWVHQDRSVSLHTSSLRIPVRWMLLSAFAYSVVLLFWLVLQPMPALQDFGEWIFQGWAMEHLLRGDTAIGAQFFVRWLPVPNMLSQWLLTALDAFFQPFLAARIFIVGYVFFAVAVCYRAAKRFAPNTVGRMFVILLSLVAFNACFWHGYMSYQLGLLVLLWYMERSKVHRTSAVAALGFSLLLFTCHASMLIAFMALVLIREWKQPGRWMLIAGLLPAVVLLALYILLPQPHPGLANLVASASPVTSVKTFIAYKAYTFAKVASFHNLIGPNGVSAAATPALYAAGVALNVFSAFLLFGGVVTGLLSGRRPRWQNLKPYWLMLFVLFVCLPADFHQVVNLGERFLYVLLVSMILWLPFTRWMTALATLTLCGFVLTAAQLRRVSLPDAQAPEAYHHAPEATGRAYASDGLFSHRLYQNDERRIELRDGQQTFTPLLFDTWMLQQRSLVPTVRAAKPPQ